MLTAINRLLAGQTWAFEEAFKDYKKDVRKKPKEDIRRFFLTNPKDFKQYENKDIYKIEKDFLKWYAEKVKDSAWRRSRQARRYTCKMLIEEIYEREYDNKLDTKYSWIYRKVFGHYSNKITQSYWDPTTNKTKSKTAYTLSPNRLDVQPYSLRLRAERIIERGDKPDVYNMRNATKELQIGHARYADMEERLQRRRIKAGLKDGQETAE